MTYDVNFIQKKYELYTYLILVEYDASTPVGAYAFITNIKSIESMTFDLFYYKFGLNILSWEISSCLLNIITISSVCHGHFGNWFWKSVLNNSELDLPQKSWCQSCNTRTPILEGFCGNLWKGTLIMTTKAHKTPNQNIPIPSFIFLPWSPGFHDSEIFLELSNSFEKLLNYHDKYTHQ